ncbi:hypothetical protein PANT_7d00162 [Moesziomyces antarcticus T-34]|uniref:Uncharacterized protein n=1 Tax=Pseudozyma antarctica (strain T-34) TaxID=1151754 RepID=M9LU52_PSEA3|nr:hypothetical protein PANT_7d00162 [Moesziomyces antarcticus T-34]
MIASNVLAIALAAAGAAAAPLAKRSSGQATYYAAGLAADHDHTSFLPILLTTGACGWTNSGSDFIVAMNAPEWAGGAHCGQTVTITNNKNGNTQTAQVADLCPGCSWGSLDMSTSLFSALNNGNMDDGPASSSNSKTVVSTPEWWADVNNACGVKLDAASLPIAISSSALLAADKLSDACGKWVQIKNNQNGKELSLQVVNYWAGAEGDVALGEAYKRLANNYENPETIESVTWGFIDGQGL